MLKVDILCMYSPRIFTTIITTVLLVFAIVDAIHEAEKCVNGSQVSEMVQWVSEKLRKRFVTMGNIRMKVIFIDIPKRKLRFAVHPISWVNE